MCRIAARPVSRDPTPGLGISDALRDAKNLAAAIIEGSDAARERYWRQRDVDSFELFNFARDMGELDNNNALSRIAVAKLAVPQRVQRVIDMVERKLSPYGVIKPLETIGWTFGALLRGRFGVLKPFFKMGKRQAALMILMAPAFQLVARWREQLGRAWDTWRSTGWREVADYTTGGMAKIDFGFVEDVEAVDVGYPDVRVPTLILHGTGDEVVPIERSRTFAAGKPWARLVELADGHELVHSLPMLLAESDAFLAEKISAT